jgi:hypothetical protein
LGKFVQRLEELAPLDLTLEFLVAEILGFAFQRANSVYLLIGLQQGVQSPGRAPA